MSQDTFSHKRGNTTLGVPNVYAWHKFSHHLREKLIEKICFMTGRIFSDESLQESIPKKAILSRFYMCNIPARFLCAAESRKPKMQF